VLLQQRIFQKYIFKGVKMDIFLLVLRFVHVLSGVFWVGGALIMNFFIGPTIGATAQAGKQFAGHLMLKTRFAMAMTIAAILTVLAGGFLYWRDSQGFTSKWMSAGSGIGFGIGGVAALIGFIFGIMFAQLNLKMSLIGSQIKGEPTPEQLAQLQNIQKQLKIVAPINVIALIIAAIFMSISRYLVF
jgi:uncharacterized membrane protein